MRASLSPAKIIEQALPESLRNRPEIADTLAGKLHAAGTFSFDDAKKSTGTFVVAQTPATQIGGQWVEHQKYFVTRGDEILLHGNLIGARRLAGSFEIKVSIQARGVNLKNVDKGVPPYAIEINLDEPKKSQIIVRADREVIVAGPVDVRLATRGTIVINSKGKNEERLPAGGKLITLQDYTLSSSGIKLSAQQGRELSRFPNTLVGVWIHLPEMTATVEAQLDRALSRRKRVETLNVLVELITESEVDRGAMAIHYNQALKAKSPNTPVLASSVLGIEKSEDPDSLRPRLVETIRTLADKYKMTAQFHFVDRNEGEKLGHDLPWFPKHIAWNGLTTKMGAAFAKLKPNPREAIFQAARESVETLASYYSAREAVVVQQMRRFALAPSDNAMNVLIMGAAHRDVIDSLPGAKPVYFNVPVEIRELVSPRVYDTVSRLRTPAEELRGISDRGGKFPEPLVREYFLFTRWLQGLEHTVVENLHLEDGSSVQWSTGLNFALTTMAVSCVTPPESRALFASAINPQNDGMHAEILLRWFEKKFDVDLRPGGTSLDELVRKVAIKAAQARL